AAFGIGFTFGPLIGAGALAFFKGHLEVIGYTASVLSLVSLILAVRLLPETRSPGSASSLRRGWLDLTAIRRALWNGAIGPVILTFFLATLGFGAFETTLALLLKDCFEMESIDRFYVFAFVGFVLMLTQGVIYRRMAHRWGEVAFITLGLVFMAAGVGSLGAVTYLASTGNPLYSLLFPALTVSVMGFAFVTPSANALISRRTDPDQQGEILGVNQSASSMARILGPVFGVTLYTSTRTHLLPYAFGAGLLILMLPLIPRIRRG
ncbi:MAG: MFS transporter, partial [Planctomycetes bacterium]|nr:MFS transporter [Planctomycetota bacterium]